MSQKEILQMDKEKLENEVKNLSNQKQMLKIKLDSINDRFKDLQHYVSILKTNNGPN
ncbi:hypothetical protein BpHYR1_052885 [Brachionus plicatilis]|uniref:Uncharacterized protein n=2 Tax=Brachionus plicatilis TaxID=10195 RepID=A0A3M7T3I0_BRAPC|nr:hypothetical protein BpHYR1_052885 [Brachionus plicatilis]